MNRYLGFHFHRYGDLFINLAACRVLKRIAPGCHLTFGINGNYRDAAPLFIDQPDIDHIHVTHNPAGGLDEEDLKWAATQHFALIFDPLADHNHAVPWWKTGRNQPQEVCYMHGLPIPSDETGKLTLNRWFEPNRAFKGYVALQAFAGSYDPNNQKQLTIARAQEVVDLIRARGYEVLQLGVANEPKLENTVRLDTDYFGAVKNMLGCRALVTTDSGFAWGASCYDHSTLGLYSHAYYGKEHVRAIQPVNPNAIYLDAENVNQIDLNAIDQVLSQLL